MLWVAGDEDACKLHSIWIVAVVGKTVNMTGVAMTV
jgi:hypothetical protein